MIVSNSVLTTLEYDKIRDWLKSCCPLQGGRDLIERLTPTDDEYLVGKWQSETTDARRLYEVKGMPAFGNCQDISDACSRAAKGAVLTPQELIAAAEILYSARRVSDYVREGKTFPTVLDEAFGTLLCNDALARRITRALPAPDQVADEASPALADIRRKKRAVNDRIREVLQHYMTGNTASSYLQDHVITSRNGRYVIPVKVEHKNEVKGLIHDTSSSGATVFVEPMAVVEANNELSLLESKERHEIERILSELSVAVSEFEGGLMLDWRTLCQLSFVFAKARLSEDMRAVQPQLSQDGSLVLKGARHPLLPRDKVVPISLQIGPEAGFDTLVVTGPNTGGKTVSLKTVGLLALMAQSGLHIPAQEGSSVSIFSGVLADIGDEQSIEMSLSTFSSHMVRIVELLAQLDEKSLVLLDELGAGTDPVEGAALAVSLIEEIRRKHALCMATTHYAELKAYALNTEGVMNASCEFDVETLRPTYKLLIGTPGKSNAFAISEKLGVPHEVIERARRHISSESIAFEDVLGELNAMRMELENEKENARRIREQTEAERREAQKAIERDRSRAEKELADARAKSQAMLQSARASSEYIFHEADRVRQIQDAQKKAEATAKARQEVRNALRNHQDLLDTLPEVYDDRGDYTLPRDPVKGDRVVIRSIGQQGVVLEDTDKAGNVRVQSGSLRTKVPKEDLRLLLPEDLEKLERGKEEKDAKKKGKPVLHRDGPDMEFKSELDLRGLTGYEAWQKVDKYLDTVYMHGLEEARLVHGKGTGALRAYLWEMLRTDRRVESMRLGKLGEGDSGVTVVTLKKGK
ncbi:MAG: endonuclease MutS2 [Clostridia bacterium]|nr:endonuclease MutS2 [Clostridia bacterium]